MRKPRINFNNTTNALDIKVHLSAARQSRMLPQIVTWCMLRMD
jgi:hypothetical protein